MSADTPARPSFQHLALIEPVLKALKDVGYETPTPIQQQTIPHVLAGKDVLGQAQTGTGKTAAFALPLLSRIDLKQARPQVMVLTPTRELAIQVAEAFQRYAARMKGFHVMPVYGGQEYGSQLRQLKRGVHVVVGTPGRVMDHMRRGTLKLESLKCLVLDEADEMLRMGFIDDVEWILEQTPEKRQIALFSATMPEPIRRITKKYLQKPEQITIKARTATAEGINQRCWIVSGMQKLEALTRILESESFEGMLIFVRTKILTVELSEKLAARGYVCSAINGDMSQRIREQTINRFKSGKLDVLVATDVAARGLDVDRVSHVINYDIPHDSEAYIHRIGRTGRAGRTGQAILFVAPRERHLLKTIEKATKQKISMMDMPSTDTINDKRISGFKQRITDTLEKDDLSFFYQLVQQYQQEQNVPALDVAAALARLAQGDIPLLLKQKKERKRADKHNEGQQQRQPGRNNADSQRHQRSAKAEKKANNDKSADKRERNFRPDPGTERFRLEVGKEHDVTAGNIVGAIANEAGLDSQYIGKVLIHEKYSTVDLPEGMPRDIFRALKKVWVSGRQLNISRMGGQQKSSSSKAGRAEKKKGKPKAKPGSKSKTRTQKKTKAKRPKRKSAANG